jgi:glucokinase
MLEGGCYYNREVSDREPLVGGIDLGGTKILSLCLDSRLTRLGYDLRETEAERGPAAVIERMVASLQATLDGRRLDGVGVSVPGPADPDRGIVTTPPNLPGWHDVPIAQELSQRTGLPVWIENDANAAALAEHRLGAGHGAKHLVLLTLGTGIGGGLVLDGRLYHGASGGAGEIGHMQLVEDGPLCGCGRRGCLEALASGRALGARAQDIVTREPDGILARLVREGGEADARALEKAADAGDASAAAAIDQAGRYLGAGLTNIVDVFNPELVVVGGGLRRLGERYLGVAIEVMRAEAYPQHAADVRIVEAELGDEAPAIGAAIIALEKLGFAPML